MEITTENAPAPIPTPTIDGNGAGESNETARILAAVDRASDQAIAEHNAEPRRRGRPPIHGRYSTKTLPMGEVGSGAGNVPLPADQAPDPLLAFAPDAPAFDEASAKLVVETLLEWLDQLGSQIVRAVALKETNDPAIADQHEKAARMSPKVVATLNATGLRLARKYSLQLEYSDELIAAGFLGTYAMGNFMLCRNLQAAGSKLRGAPLPLAA